MYFVGTSVVGITITPAVNIFQHLIILIYLYMLFCRTTNIFLNYTSISIHAMSP